MDIKLFITDIDGVWTDGGMYYDQTGNEWKKFNTADSAGVLFLRLLDIPTAIITGEDTKIVKRRADKLGISHLFMGVKNKLKVATALCEALGISLENVAYIGDDINDIVLLREVGLSACPANAPDYIKNEVDWEIPIKGGDGAFRGFVEKYLVMGNQLDLVISKYNQSIK
jgi:3-deoxy-D-manno-octulosonate 8-phosphate phosphatase (KDO 8-P phosphatase)